MKDTNCIILHGCPSDEEKAMDPATRTYDKHWMILTQQQLNKAGIETKIPLMPEPWQPNYEKFKEVFERLEVTERTILIGHSCGCAFLVRWLGETKRNVAALILVAPWKIPDENDAARQAFYTYPIDRTIASRVGRIVMFTADDEEEDGKRSVRLFHDALGGELIDLKGRGHYTMDDMGTDAFPELIEVVLREGATPV